MSNIDDNNLDDLLRRAAEKYPLRTDSADWDKLVSDLDKDPSLILPPVNGEDRRRRRRFFWLFLLLPLAGVGYYAWHGSGKPSLAQHTVEPAQQGGQTGATGVPAGQTGVTTGQGGETDKAAGQSGQAKEPETEGRVSGTAGEKGGPGSGPTGQSGQDRGPAGKNGKSDGATGQGQTGIPTVRTNVPAGGQAISARQDGKTDVAHPVTEKNGKTNNTAGENGAGLTGASIGKRKRGGHVGGENGVQENTGQEQSAEQTHENIGGGTTEVARQGQTGTNEEKELTPAANNLHRAATRGSAIVNIPVKSNTASPINKPKKEKPNHSFYAGIMGAPDLSSVKFQSVKSVGAMYGVLLGYSFNDRWAIEAGLSYGKKKYFTKGEYFDTSGPDAPYVLKHVDQLQVQGNCTMWEIPVNVRYNLTTGGKMNWFVKAGVSAYYMSRENYDCWGYLYGSPWWKNWDTMPARNRWSANLNLSIGYEQRIGKIGNVRLEPYVKVPMSGIGTGKLFIMSAGLNIGITRKLW